jgi:riboflavin synthase alpha subunit
MNGASPCCAVTVREIRRGRIDPVRFRDHRRQSEERQYCANFRSCHVMFSGRITETGTVLEAGPRLVVEAPKTTAGLSAGSSVNVGGTCLTAAKVDRAAGSFTVEISAETARRSALGDLAPGSGVNLELPLRVGDALDGHLVQGHTDAVGKVARVEAESGGCLRVWIRPPKRFLDEIVAKGSVAVDGVSLTVAEVLADRFSVALVPVTAQPGVRPAGQVGPRAVAVGPPGRQPLPRRAALGRRADRACRDQQGRHPARGRRRRGRLRPGPGS